MAEENEIFENTIVFTILKYLSYFLMIITGFILTKFLGPAAFGLYSAMMLVLRYSRYSFMGFFSACFKKISILKGKQQLSKLQEIRDNTFAPSLYISLILGLLLFMSSFMLRYDTDVLIALRWVSILIVLQQIFSFYTIYLRTDKLFSLYGLVDLIFKLLRLVFIFILIWKFKLNGVLMALCLAYVFSLLFGIYRKNYLYHLTFSFKKAKNLFLFGLPNTLFGTMGTVFTSADKIMIIAFFSRTYLGFYSFAVLVLETITFIPANIAIVILPSQLERFGANKSKDNIKNMLVFPMTIISYLLPIILGGAFIFSEPVVTYIFPEYLPALDSLYFLSLGAFFLSNIFILENYIVSINKEKNILFSKLFFILIGVILNYFLIVNGYGIKGVAIATSFTYMLYFSFLIIYSFLALFQKQKIFREIGVIVFPFFYMLIVLKVISLYAHININLTTDFTIATFKYAIFLVLNIPLWLYLQKKTSLFAFAYTYIRKMLRLT